MRAAFAAMQGGFRPVLFAGRPSLNLPSTQLSSGGRGGRYMSSEEHDEREEVAEDAAEDLEVTDEAADDVRGGGRRRKLDGDSGLDSGTMARR